MKLLQCLLLFALTTMATAQVYTFNLRADSTFVGWTSPPCLGNSTECAAHSSVSLSGANTVLAESIINPGAGVKYIRCTDSNTFSSPRSIHATISGGSNEVLWSKTAGRLMVFGSNQAGPAPMAFDPVAQTCTKMYSNTYVVPGQYGAFSKVTDNKWYSLVSVGGNSR